MFEHHGTDSPFRVHNHTPLEDLPQRFGIAYRLVDLNHLFETTSNPPILLNSFNVAMSNDRELLDQMLYTFYDGDSLNVVPSCDCGCSTGAAAIESTCPQCGSLVMTVSERPLESLLWMAPPEGVDTFLNPQAWTMLSKALTHGGTNGLEWLCNPTMPLGSDPHKEIRRLMDLGLDRGINAFYRNFDDYIEVLFNAGIISGANRRAKDELYQFIRTYRKAIFAKHLPIPSRLAFVAEKTVTGSFADKTMFPALNAIRTISMAEHSNIPLDLRRRQSLAMRANSLMAQYYEDFKSATLTSKKGLVRKNLYGSPLYFTFRAVITSLSGRHDYDELHLPWSVAVSAYTLHLISKMLRRNNPETGLPFTPNDCMKHIHQHTLNYSPLLDELFQELIYESPFKGLPVLFNRNPSLDRGSIQEFFVTKINPDPNINAVAMSVLTLKAPNADFDGDALNGHLILDNYMEAKARALAPHMGALDLDHPYRMSGNQSFAPPVAATLANWLHRGR